MSILSQGNPEHGEVLTLKALVVRISSQQEVIGRVNHRPILQTGVVFIMTLGFQRQLLPDYLDERRPLAPRPQHMRETGQRNYRHQHHQQQGNAKQQQQQQQQQKQQQQQQRQRQKDMPSAVMPTALGSNILGHNTGISVRNRRKQCIHLAREHVSGGNLASGNCWSGQSAGTAGQEADKLAAGFRDDTVHRDPLPSSSLAPDEVHTFPGICDDYPIDDLSNIAIAPLPESDDNGILPAVKTEGIVRTATRAPWEAIHKSSVPHDFPNVYTAQSSTAVLQQSLGSAPGFGNPKQEAGSPPGFAKPGPSGLFPSGSSGHQPSVGSPWTANPTPGTSEPVIPLTALELLSKDSSTSGSEEETTRPTTSAASTTSVRKVKSKVITARRRSNPVKTLDRRKTNPSETVQSDNSSSDTSDGEDLQSTQGLTADEVDRLERRRLSNRVAAQKCRQRQRQHYRGLMKEIQDWECKNTGLNYEVRQLQKTLKQLVEQVEHHDTQCPTSTQILTPSVKEEYKRLLEDLSHAKGKDSPSSHQRESKSPQ